MKSRILFPLLFFSIFGIGLFCYNYLSRSESLSAETIQTKQMRPAQITEPNIGTPSNTQTPETLPTKNDPSSLTSHNLELLESIMQRDTSNVDIVKNPDGSRTAHLNGTYRTVSAAKRLPDGTLKIGCFENFEALEDFISDSNSVKSQ